MGSATTMTTKKRIEQGSFLMVLVLFILIGAALISEITCQKSDLSSNEIIDDSGVHSNHIIETQTIDLGSNFELALQYEDKPGGKLRISETIYRYALHNKLVKAEPIAKAKVTMIDELVKCDNLTLAKQDRLDMLDCKSLEEHSSNPYIDPTNQQALNADVDNNALPSSMKFVHHIKAKGRHSAKFPFEFKSKHTVFHIYELRPDVVARNVENITASVLAEHNFDVNDFGVNKFYKGYYFEWDHSVRSPSESNCFGELYIVVNRSGYSVPDAASWPDFNAEYDYLRNEAIDNGYLLSLRGVQCGKPQVPLFSLNTDFTIGQKSSFPYFILNHTTYTAPLNFFLNYEAKIHQEKNQTTPDIEGAYTTHVHIRSRSGLADLFNFNLDQTFNNINSTFGLENMTAITADYVLHLDSSWDLEKFFKHLFVFSSSEMLDVVAKKGSLSSLGSISYIDDQSSDHVVLAIRLRRSMITGEKTDSKADEASTNDADQTESIEEDEDEFAFLYDRPSNDTKLKVLQQMLEKFPHHVIQPLRQVRNEL